MRKLLLTVGFVALAIGLLWIGQGTGAIAWPSSSFMINQLQWAGYGAALAALGLILIWQGKAVDRDTVRASRLQAPPTATLFKLIEQGTTCGRTSACHQIPGQHALNNFRQSEI